MKRKILALIIGLTAAFQLTAYADTYDSITIDADPVLGETFTVTVSVTSDDDIDFMSTSLEYDDSVIEFVEGDGAGGGGILTLQAFPDSQPGVIECVLTFRAVGEGDCFMTLSNGYVFSKEGIVLAQPSASASVHVEGEAVTEAPPEGSSEDESTDDSSKAEAVTQPPEESQPEVTKTEQTESSAASDHISSAADASDDSTSSADTDSSELQRDKYKDLLNPALAIVLVTLIVALFIIITWMTKTIGGKKGDKRKKGRR